ncbi:MAG: hypothetical protein ACPGVB_13440 [Chitinophagales bacterium]
MEIVGKVSLVVEIVAYGTSRFIVDTQRVRRQLKWDVPLAKPLY